MLFTSQNVLVIISKEEISHNENRNCWNVPRQWLVVNVHSHDYFLPPRGLRQMQPLHFRSTFSSGENEIILRVHILNLDGMKTASDVHKLTIGEKKLSGSCWINVNSSAISFSQIYACFNNSISNKLTSSVDWWTKQIMIRGCNNTIIISYLSSLFTSAIRVIW